MKESRAVQSSTAKEGVQRHGADVNTRLTDVSPPTNFGEKFPYLSTLDKLTRQVLFNYRSARSSLGFTHMAPFLLAVIGLILGSWDLGSGELSSGGDYNRGGIFGSESGFLHVSGGALILSFLSLIITMASYLLLMAIFPLMRENMIYLVFGILTVEYGQIASHASDPYFPFGSGIASWVGFTVSNLIMLFIAIGVVRRSVMETRDFHVDVMHMHPDPRKMRAAKEDHSLLLWNFSLVLWLIFLNLSAWAGAHSIARPPPIAGDLGGIVIMHIATGTLAFLFLIHVAWYPQFMMGNSSGGIQSRLARILSEGQDTSDRVAEVGKCPNCGVSSAALRDEEGVVSVVCLSEECEGRGEIGSACPICSENLNAVIACGSCGTKSHVETHFYTEGELW